MATALVPVLRAPLKGELHIISKSLHRTYSLLSFRSFLESELDAFYSSYYRDLRTASSSQLDDQLELDYESFPPEVVQPVDPTGLSESELNEVQKKVLRSN